MILENKNTNHTVTVTLAVQEYPPSITQITNTKKRKTRDKTFKSKHTKYIHSSSTRSLASQATVTGNTVLGTSSHVLRLSSTVPIVKCLCTPFLSVGHHTSNFLIELLML